MRSTDRSRSTRSTRSARSARTLGVAGLAVVGVAACTTLAGCHSAPGSDDTVQHSYSGVHRIVVNAGPGDVQLLRGDGPGVDVTLSRHWTTTPPKATPVQAGDTLTIESSCREHGADALFGDCTVDARVLVPAGAVVVVRSAAGSIGASGLDVASFDASTQAGSVTASFGSAPDSIRAVTSAGSVLLTVPPSDYRVDAGTAAGATDLGIANDPAAAHSVYAHSEAGDVRIVRR